MASIVRCALPVSRCALSRGSIRTRAARSTGTPRPRRTAPTSRGSARIWGDVVQNIFRAKNAQGARSSRVNAAADAALSLDDSSGGGDGGAKPPAKKTGENEGEGEEEEGKMAWFYEAAEWWIQAFNVFAAVLLVFKGLQASYFCFMYLLNGCKLHKIGDGSWYNKARVVLGRGVVLSLEFLLISDILETVVYGADQKRLINIGLTAVVRTLIDYFTSKEIDEAIEELEHLEHKKHSKKAAPGQKEKKEASK
mmetsp:Transcript_17008/g.36994  ORF Transcript_17008/g.36994 Transcript_17008/m.36994 type:complete len:252 (-) Transcript_17008:333-1088(-)|eukprot:CAMPEP_0118921594 /NCGR_PEP_ID=MMETSP1169-20130426/815_1 /TAXON_ID=36882 /ORGANISM="Pyramimonas obovata, Strain CCMP722" /LENGTH=251 /DNA_ID=CAMNT_0006862343 /DNA_START=55 /DNA_END=810 /DNA_ORIENTATION=+